MVAAARTVARQRRSDQVVAHLRAMIVEADMDFHRARATGAANPVLPLVLQPILAPIQTGMLRGARLSAATACALAEHRRIRDAVAAHDPAAARAAMQAHMETARAETGARVEA